MNSSGECQYRVHRGHIWFDKELRENHRRLRQSIPVYILEGNFLSLLTAPIIYSLLLPFVVLDLPRLSDSSRVHGSSLLRWLATASSMPCMAMF